MTALRRRLPVLVGVVSAVLAVVLAVGAVLLALQTAPTPTAEQARAHLRALVLDVVDGGAAPFVETEGPPCPWLGIDGWPASHQVRPRLELHVPGDPAALVDAVARAGGPVTRDGAGVEVRLAGGYVLSVRTADGVVLVGESPCVWPAGTREPAR